MRTGQLAASSRLIEEAGSSADPVGLAAAFDENWIEFERCWEVNAGPYTPEASTDFICGRGARAGDDRHRLHGDRVSGRRAIP